MKTENLVINTNGEKPVHITILEGRTPEPLPLHEPRRVTIEGDIKSISEFLSKRATLGTVNLLDSVINVDREKGRMELIINQSDYYKGTVEASLYTTIIWSAFAINSDKDWEPSELAKFLRLNRYFIKGDPKPLIVSLRDLKAKINRNIQETNDNRGNTINHVDKMVDAGDIPTSFQLNIPMFVGQPKVDIEVEIDIDVIGSDKLVIRLVSPQSAESKLFTIESVINDELEKIKTIAPEIVIIEN
jgi:hypothetical protein